MLSQASTLGTAAAVRSDSQKVVQDGGHARVPNPRRPADPKKQPPPAPLPPPQLDARRRSAPQPNARRISPAGLVTTSGRRNSPPDLVTTSTPSRGKGRGAQHSTPQQTSPVKHGNTQATRGFLAAEPKRSLPHLATAPPPNAFQHLVHVFERWMTMLDSAILNCACLKTATQTEGRVVEAVSDPRVDDETLVRIVRQYHQSAGSGKDPPDLSDPQVLEALRRTLLL